MRKREDLLAKANGILKEAKDDESFSPVEFSEVVRWRLSFEVEVDKRDELFRIRELLDLTKSH